MYQLIIIDDEEKILEGIAELFPWNQIGFEVAGTFTQASSASAGSQTDFPKSRPAGRRSRLLGQSDGHQTGGSTEKPRT